MNKRLTDINSYSQGLIQDSAPVNQPDNSYRFALNLVRDSESGYIIQSEPGNSLCASVPEGFTIIGTIYGEDDTTYIFSTDNIDSEIGQIKDCNYTTLIRNSCLNFNTSNLITGEYRVRKGCNKTLYWQDGLNPDRWLDVDDLEFFSNCDKFNMVNSILEPCIELESLTYGELTEGTYSVSIDYVDDSNNTVYSSSLSNPVYIKENYFNINITNVDTNQAFVRINIAYATSEDATKQAHSIGILIPTEPEINYVYQGFNTSQGDINIDYSSLTIPDFSISNSKVMEQVQNRLVRANIVEDTRDYSTYQRYASKIETYYKISHINYSDIDDTKDTIKTFMPNEVVATGIVYIHDDGTESPVFHIPGRSKLPQDEETTSLGATEEVEVTYTINNIIKRVNSTGVEVLFNYNFNQSIPDLSLEFVLGSETDSTAEGYVTSQSGGAIFNFTSSQQSEINGEIYIYSGTQLINVIQIVFAGDNSYSDTFTYTKNTPTDFKWKYTSTAIKLEDNKGLNGYYECTNNTYQSPNCTTNYWGVDSDGNELEGNPIRHHRLPCRSLEPTIDSTGVRPIYLEFDNIEYPNESIIGHYFVYSKHNESDKLVVDNGILNALRRDDNDGFSRNIFSYLVTKQTYSTDWNYFITPNTLSNNKINQATHIKLNEHRDYNDSDFNFYRKEYNRGQADWFIGARVSDYKVTNSSDYIDKIEYDYNLQPGQKQTQDSDLLVNLSQSNYINFIKPKSSIPDIQKDKLFYAQSLRYKNVFCNIDTINYVKASNCYYNLSSEQVIRDGNAFITNFRVTDYKLTRREESIWQELVLGVALVLGAALTVVTAGVGAVGVSAGISAILAAGIGTSVGIGAVIATVIGFNTLLIQGIQDEIRDGEYDNQLNDIDGFNNTDGDFLDLQWVYNSAEIIESFYIDSWDNYYLSRKQNNFDCGKWLDDKDLNADNVISYIYEKIAYYDEEEENNNKKHKLKPIYCPEIYFYNEDLSIPYFDYYYFPIQSTYQWCSKCINAKPYRIVFSPQSFDEELSDAYRINYVDDYIDIPSERGEITGLKYKNNQLIVHTTETTFILKPYPQQIATDTSTAYIKTDDFFSIPATDLIQTDTGYGGLQYQYATSNTEYGYMWLDKEGSIHNLSSSISEPSDKGMEFFFKNNLPNISDAKITFDPFFERYIVYTDDFVISYSPKLDTWISFHSYISDFTFNDSFYFYSVQSNNIYRHNHKGNYHTYFGTQYPFIIETVSNNYNTNNLNSIHFYSVFEQATNSGFIPVKETYSQGIVYSDLYSTGLFNINYIDQTSNPYSNLRYNSSSKNCIVTDHNHKISGLYDYSNNTPVFQNIFPILRTNKLFINTDLNKEDYNLSHLRDKYHYVRLIYNGNNRVNHFLTSTNSTKSIR